MTFKHYSFHHSYTLSAPLMYHCQWILLFFILDIVHDLYCGSLQHLSSLFCPSVITTSPFNLASPLEGIPS